MLIRVKYSDNRYDMVRPEILDNLLKSGGVAEFLRRDGWVSSSSATVRKESKADFKGAERRTRRTFSLRTTDKDI